MKEIFTQIQVCHRSIYPTPLPLHPSQQPPSNMGFNSMIKGIHLTLEVKTSFINYMPTTGFSTESST
jgi:hypothetical protein